MKEKKQSAETKRSSSTDSKKNEDFEIMPTANPDEKNMKDMNFYKLFLMGFERVLKRIGNKKTELFLWIIHNMTKDNLLYYSFREISDKSGISYATVAQTMKELHEEDFLRRESSGIYIVNPDVIFKGTYQRRCMAWYRYCETDRNEQMSFNEKRLHNIQKTISSLQKQEERIKRDMKFMNTEPDTKEKST